MRWTSDHFSSPLPSIACWERVLCFGVPVNQQDASQKCRRKRMAGHWYVARRTHINWHCSASHPRQGYIRPNGVFILRLVHVVQRKLRLETSGCCTVCAACTGSSPLVLSGWQHRINQRVFYSDVNWMLFSRGTHAYRPAKRPMLRKGNRLEWARQHQHRSMLQLRHVIFYDESWYLLHCADGRLCVRREQGQGFNEDYILSTVAQGGRSVYVWGPICCGGWTNLILLEGNVNTDSYRRTMETPANKARCELAGIPQRWRGRADALVVL